MSPLLTKKFPIAYTIGIAVAAVAITFGLTSLQEKKAIAEIESQAPHQCAYNVKRIEGYNYIRPILFVDEDCESEDLASVKYKINDIIARYKAAGDANTASVFLRGKGEWTAINETEKYEPGSLFKVPIMMAILKASEDKQGFLDQQVLFNKPPMEINKNINFKASKSLQRGQTYTLRELLTYMIVYSDNNATMLLETFMNPNILQKMFTDLGLEAPNMHADHYYFGVKDYSIFMRTLYNAGYLNIENSEYAAELLGKCEFKDGIVKGLPANTKVMHKFGESGNDNEVQLHESAIVYVGQKPYLITIMTKGKSMAKLSQLIADISAAAYQEMAERASM